MRYRTRLYIDLNLLKENFQLLKELCPDNQVLFMIKANAYGHGMVPIVRYSVQELGINEFGVATLGEARRLRDELSDLEFEIYVFSDIHLEFQSSFEYYLSRRFVPVISNMADLDFVLSCEGFQYFPICLKFNTGMNRLGFSSAQQQEVIDKLKKTDRTSIFHLMTHLGMASDIIEKQSPCDLQDQCFQEIKNNFLDQGIAIERSSISNSGAIEQKFGLNETHIRPGLILYGPSALHRDVRDRSNWKGKTISRLETYVINSFPVKAGERVGYGGTPAPSSGVIALIALGYGDGFSGRNKAPSIYLDGVEGMILGRINMDMGQVFFPGRDASFVKAGQSLVIWGHDPKEILNLADQTDTIPYEHFCHMTSRVPRVYSK